MKIVLIFLTAFLISSCHSPKKAVETNPVATQKEQSPSSDELAALNNLVVSFYSTGSGVNYKAALEIENFISDYAVRTKTPLPFKKISWGKEGEVDYCIELSGWDVNARGKFISVLKDKLSGVQVHIRENYP